MSLLLPLGLLGLIGIIVLIIIYLIKPNYQNKFISSTFVWKLSLKYRKKKLPTSKLRNIILIICQVLILTLAALILAKPVHMYLTSANPEEVVLIVDSSASMRAIDDASSGETRYERAVTQVKSMAAQTFANDGLVSIIVADRKAEFLVSRADQTKVNDVNLLLDELVTGADLSCSYGSSDVDGAISLCDEVVANNPDTKIYLYTDTTYTYTPEGITVVKSYDANNAGWNASILNAYTEFNNNYYDLVVEVATYGRDASIELSVTVEGANAVADPQKLGSTIKYSGSAYQVDCFGEQTIKVVFKASQVNDFVETETSTCFDISADRFYSYRTISISIADNDDSMPIDDNFYIYGGERETVKVQYSSRLYDDSKGKYEGSTNRFVNGFLSVFSSVYSKDFDLEITEQTKGEFLTEGFDIYIFEHEMPTKMPTDGIVIIIDPLGTISGAGFTPAVIKDYSAVSQPLTMEDETHPIMRNVGATDITITRYVAMSTIDGSYHTLASCDGAPLIMVKNDGNEKVFVLNFSLHYSNLPMLVDWPIMMSNVFNYFMPQTLDQNTIEVYNSVNVNSRGDKLNISYAVEDDVKNEEITSFPATFTANTPGTYTFVQYSYFGDEIIEYVYVKTPASESNIFAVMDSLDEPYRQTTEIDAYDDLLLWFAIALAALVLLEWWLKDRDNA